MSTYLAVPSGASITGDMYVAAKNYARVMFQKRKVVLDAELNELQQRVRADLALFGTILASGWLFNGDGFKVMQSTPPFANFKVLAGSALANGMVLTSSADKDYSSQVFPLDYMMKFMWDSSVVIPPLTVNMAVGTVRHDLAVLSIVLREVFSSEDNDIKNPNLNRETAGRIKADWGVSVVEGVGGYPTVPAVGPLFTYENAVACFRTPIAWLNRPYNTNQIYQAHMEDLRSTLPSDLLAYIAAQIAATRTFATNEAIKYGVAL